MIGRHNILVTITEEGRHQINYGSSFYTVCTDAIEDVDCPKLVRDG